MAKQQRVDRVVPLVPAGIRAGVEILTDAPLTPSSELGPYRMADYLALPDEPRCELLYGRFYLLNAPRTLHQVVSFLIHRFLDDLAVALGGFTLASPVDVVLADHSVVQPDVIYMTPERRRTHLGPLRITGAPDLVVEVLSPGTVRRDHGEKLRLYAESGVREYWLVDSEIRQIEFLVNCDGRFTVALPFAEVYRSEALPEIALDLAELWRQAELRIPGSDLSAAQRGG
jgi:Uma2 family endonuclease